MMVANVYSCFSYIGGASFSQLLRLLKHFPLDLLHKVQDEYQHVLWSTCICYWHDPNNASPTRN